MMTLTLASLAGCLLSLSPHQAEPPATVAETTPPPAPKVGLQPVTSRPDEQLDKPAPTFSPQLENGTQRDPFRVSFGTSYSELRRTSSLLNSINADEDGDLLSALARRSRAGYGYDAQLEPIFSDRSNIYVATNNPGDHSESHFILTNLEISKGVYFRADGVGRAFTEDRRYTTLSAEAYFMLGANAGMSLGFDLIRTGLPSEDFNTMMDEGLFARFIIGF
ncbi:MAG: hypothetical protein KF902_03225 [Phycisphaeraceae bacterium]|nr:hypothetical protein [Phycisphaeraceae bacterium]MCW5769125.1 hypothetical protein [Phycisphaeraceae bacterium]